MRYSVESDYKLLLRNLAQYRWFATIMFSVIALSLAGIGYFMPKTYTSSTTLIMGGETVLEPILRGTTISTGAKTDWAQVAKEILYGRKTIAELMKNLGYVKGTIATQQDEIRLKKIKSNIDVELAGDDNYLRISYTDEDPAVAKRVATELTRIFINGIQGYHTEETEEAFDFLDSQVKSYHEKLKASEERLKEFKIGKLETGASSEEAVSRRLDRLQEVLDQSKLDLEEALIKKASLERQLSGEVKATISLTKQSQYMKRLQDLRDKLSELRLVYHEEYPDIQNIKYQIEDLKRQINAEQSDQSNSSIAGVQDGFKANPVYQDLKLKLSQVQTRIATLNTRIRETEDNIEEERKKGGVVHTSDAQLAELTRDYEVNKKLYEELLKRRESARLSKEIDEQQKGLNVKIYEPAFLPRIPSGLQFIHYVLLGLALGLVTPVILIYFYQLLDSAIKAPEAIQARLGVSALGMIPDVLNHAEREAAIRKERARRLMIYVTLAGIVLIGLLKLLQAD